MFYNFVFAYNCKFLMLLIKSAIKQKKSNTKRSSIIILEPREHLKICTLKRLRLMRINVTVPNGKKSQINTSFPCKNWTVTAG